MRGRLGGARALGRPLTVVAAGLLATATLGASGPQAVLAGAETGVVTESTIVSDDDTVAASEPTAEQRLDNREDLIAERREVSVSRSTQRSALKEPASAIVSGTGEVEAETVEEAPETADEPTDSISGGECASGSDVESGLASNAISVHRAVCAEFPSVTSYGGVRSGDGGAHGTGQALDIMISGSTGDAIAEFVRANASSLGVSEVIWAQTIWTVERSSEGWRSMEDRGSTTANHYDHVHVTVY